jgi:hypothetical protein
MSMSADELAMLIRVNQEGGRFTFRDLPGSLMARAAEVAKSLELRGLVHVVLHGAQGRTDVVKVELTEKGRAELEEQ